MRVLRFSMGNYRSFKTYTELCFTSSTDPNPKDVAQVVGVHGPVSSGKSNLVAGLKTFQDFLQSHVSAIPGAGIDTEPFVGSGEEPTKDGPTSFEIDFLSGDLEYRFGFVYDRRQVLEEYLFGRYRGAFTKLYHRLCDTYTWHRGFKGQKARLSKWTNPNSLFLSCAAYNNHALLGKIFSELMSGISFAQPVTEKAPLFEEWDPIIAPKNEDLLKKVLQCVGASGVRKVHYPHSKSQHSYRVMIERQERSNVWYLDPERESSGTKALLQRLNELLSLSGLYVIDDLGSMMDPSLCLNLIRLFQQEDHFHVQLLFTTRFREFLGLLPEKSQVHVSRRALGYSILTTKDQEMSGLSNSYDNDIPHLFAGTFGGEE